MTAKALGFLQEEMEGPGLWRYWSSRNQRHGLLPPDLDDTCCIAFVLAKNDKALLSNKDVILANRNRKGVFYTWLVPRSSSTSRATGDTDDVTTSEALLLLSVYGGIDDVDCVANANALLYLGDNADTRGAVDYLVETVLNEQEDGCSDYYPHRLSLYYMLSRAYSEGVLSLEGVRVPVIDRVLRMQNREGAFGNELLTALALCTLLNFHSPTPAMDEAVNHVLRTQRADGSWPRSPMFLGPAPYYGSEDLTTAFCVEALAKYRALPGASR